MRNPNRFSGEEAHPASGGPLRPSYSEFEILRKQTHESLNLDETPVEMTWERDSRFYKEIAAIRRDIVREIAAAIKGALLKKHRIDPASPITIHLTSERNRDELHMEYGYHVTFTAQNGETKTGNASFELEGTRLPWPQDKTGNELNPENRVPIHIGFAKSAPLRKDFFQQFSRAIEELENRVRRQFAELPYRLCPNSPIYISIESHRTLTLKDPQTGKPGRKIFRLRCKIFFANEERQTMELPLDVDFDYLAL